MFVSFSWKLDDSGLRHTYILFKRQKDLEDCEVLVDDSVHKACESQVAALFSIKLGAIIHYLTGKALNVILNEFEVAYILCFLTFIEPLNLVIR